MAKQQYVFPPDAGSQNAGLVPNATHRGRGIMRTGDIRHIGDLIPSEGAAAQTGTWTPGTVGQNVPTPKLDNDNAAPQAHDRGFDSQAAPETFTSAGKFDGLDSSGEGFDPYSGKQGGQA